MLVNDMVMPVSHLTGRCHLCSARDGLFDVLRSRTVFGSRDFSIAAWPQACNQLPADIRNTATYSTFKHYLKSFLFSIAYGLWILSYSFLGFIIHLLYC